MFFWIGERDGITAQIMANLIILGPLIDLESHKLMPDQKLYKICCHLFSAIVSDLQEQSASNYKPKIQYQQCLGKQSFQI